METDRLKAILAQQAIFAVIDTLIEIDPRAAAITRGWNNVIQFRIDNGGPSAYIQFKDGRMTVTAGVHDNPTVLFVFDSVEKFNGMVFDGKTVLPKKGLFHLFLLLKFQKLTTLLDKTLKPNGAAPDPESLKRTVTCMLTLITSGMKQLAENDPTLEPTIHHIADGDAQFSILPNGPHAYIEIKNRKFTTHKGIAPNPAVTMEIKNEEIAYKLFNGEIDAMAAIGVCDITLSGLLPIFGDLSYVMSKLDKYLK